MCLDHVGQLIRPKCITILYCNFILFTDIFHFKVLFLCCFGLFYTVCNFPVSKQQKPEFSGRKVDTKLLNQIKSKSDEIIGEEFFMGNDWESLKEEVRGPTSQPEGCLAR